MHVQIREDLRANEIDIYPQKEFDEDAEDRMINEKIRVCLLVTISLSLLLAYALKRAVLFMTHFME